MSCPLTKPKLLCNVITQRIVVNKRLSSPWLSSPCVCLFFCFFSVVFHTGNARLLIKSWRGRMRHLSRPTVSGYCKLNFDV